MLRINAQSPRAITHWHQYFTRATYLVIPYLKNISYVIFLVHCLKCCRRAKIPRIKLFREVSEDIKQLLLLDLSPIVEKNNTANLLSITDLTSPFGQDLTKVRSSPKIVQDRPNPETTVSKYYNGLTALSARREVLPQVWNPQHVASIILNEDTTFWSSPKGQ